MSDSQLIGVHNPKWHVAIKSVPHRDGFSYPVIEYWWGTDALCGGTVKIWPLHATINVHSSREGRKSSSLEGDFKNKDEAVYAITNAIAELPPMFHEVIGAMTSIKASHAGNVHGPKAIQSVCDEIEAEWSKLLKPYFD